MKNSLRSLFYSVCFNLLTLRTKVKVSYSATKHVKVLFQLIDVKGKIMDEYQETKRYLTHSHDFNVGNLPQGVYLIRTIADKIVTGKFIKE
jgi:hypothetical protein